MHNPGSIAYDKNYKYVHQLIQNKALTSRLFWTITDELYDRQHVYFKVIDLEDDTLQYSGVELVRSASWLTADHSVGHVFITLDTNRKHPRLTVMKEGVETYIDYKRNTHEWLEGVIKHYREVWIKREGGIHQ